MTLVLRSLVGIIGGLAVMIAARLWIDPTTTGGTMGLIGVGTLGQATLRADVGGFFGAAGAFALVAALRNDGRLLTPPLVMIALALGGRLVAAAVNGVDARATPSIVIEAVLLAALAAGWLKLPRGA